MEKYGTKWSREETILAFELYCRTPFGKIGQRNPEIIELAKLIGRTPSSVARKMSNLASCDPELKKRNVKGLEHISKLDAVIFQEFENNLEELKYETCAIKDKMGDKNKQELKKIEQELEHIKPGEYRERMKKERLGQYYFRTAILNSYSGKCCITQLALPSLLVASHIKPWSVCEEATERTNPRNGLCLNALHDHAFDKGLITIDDKYRIRTSSKLSNAQMDNKTREWLKNYEKQEIILPDKFLPGKAFIEYHNDVIFIP